MLIIKLEILKHIWGFNEKLKKIKIEQRWGPSTIDKKKSFIFKNWDYVANFRPDTPRNLKVQPRYSTGLRGEIQLFTWT